MLTAATLIARANQNARTDAFSAQALDYLNIILSDLCETYDLALARGTFNFNFNPALTSNFGSGPYNMPLDYLRTSGSSGSEGVNKSAWYLWPAPGFPSAIPVYMTPIDLAEFDLYPKLPQATLPERWATDMGGPLTQRIVLATTVSLGSGSVTGTATSATNLAIGQSVAGEGIQPGTTLTNVVGTMLTFSLPATATINQASCFFGIAPVGYAYPPPLGSYPVTIRYQRKMPPITDTSRIPWFPNEGYLIKKLSAMMMMQADDSRRAEFDVSADNDLRKYLDLSDDKTNRAQKVMLDLRAFGGGTPYDRARMTKNAGW